MPYKSLRDRIAVNTEENAKVLREKIEDLQNEKAGARINSKYKNVEIIKQAKLTVSQPTFSRFMKEQITTLSGDNHSLLANFLFDEGVFTKSSDVINRLIEVDNSLFHTLVDFLKIGSGTVDKACHAYPGTYKVWQTSLHWPGCYAIGSLEIIHEDGCVIKTRETQRFSGIDGDHQLIEEALGYLFRKDGKVYIISTGHKSRKSLRLFIVDSASFDNDERVYIMEGIMIGVFKGKIFSSMTYIERWNNPPADRMDFCKELDIVKPDKVHELIRNRLGLFKLENGAAFIG